MSETIVIQTPTEEPSPQLETIQEQLAEVREEIQELQTEPEVQGPSELDLLGQRLSALEASQSSQQAQLMEQLQQLQEQIALLTAVEIVEMEQQQENQDAAAVEEALPQEPEPVEVEVQPSIFQRLFL